MCWEASQWVVGVALGAAYSLVTVNCPQLEFTCVPLLHSHHGTIWVSVPCHSRTMQVAPAPLLPKAEKKKIQSHILLLRENERRSHFIQKQPVLPGTGCVPLKCNPESLGINSISSGSLSSAPPFPGGRAKGTVDLIFYVSGVLAVSGRLSTCGGRQTRACTNCAERLCPPHGLRRPPLWCGCALRASGHWLLLRLRTLPQPCQLGALPEKTN